MKTSEHSTQVKAFDKTKTGVKGLADSGITELPSMFHLPPDTLASLKAQPPPLPEHLKIPTLDLNVERRSVVEKFGEAAEKWGFFQVINHGIQLDMLDKMIEGARGFHEQDPESKKRYYTRDFKTNNFYYMSNFDLYNSSASWRDTLGCYTAPDPPCLEDLPPICGEIMMEYSKELMKLGELVFELLSEALGLNPNHLKDINCSKSQVLLGQYYPLCPQPNLTLRLKKHTVFSFITILLQGKIGGLQVLHDKYWIDVPPLPGALVINIGDLLQLITNDKFKSVEHRVIANGYNEPRISMVCFFSNFMKEDPHVYGPIKELLSDENPPKYRDFSLTEFSNVFSSKTIDSPAFLHFKI